MKGLKNNTLIILLLAFFVGLLIIYLLFFYKPETHWHESLTKSGNMPYDLKMIYELLDEDAPGEGMVKVDKPLNRFFRDKKTETGSNYIFIGQAFFPGKASSDSLIQFIERGNHVFIAAASVPEFFDRQYLQYSDEDSLKVMPADSVSDVVPGDFKPGVGDGSYDAVSDSIQSVKDSLEQLENSYSDENVVAADSTTANSDSLSIAPLPATATASFYKHIALSRFNINFRHPQARTAHGYTFQHVTNFRPDTTYITYCNDSVYIDSSRSRTVLAMLDGDKVVYLKIKIGKGTLFYHSVPSTFTNYYMLTGPGLDYAEKVFAHLPVAKKVYWDDYNKFFNRGDGDSNSTPDSPIRFILSKPALRWAWYIALGMLIIYVIFYAKRKHRPIAVLQPNDNTTIEYVETVGRLYLNDRSNKEILQVKMKNLFSFVKNRFDIPLHLHESEWIKRTALLSGVPENRVAYLLQMFKSLDMLPEISDQNLMELQKEIEEFYNQSK